MILGIMGPGRSGKDLAAEWFVRHANMKYNGTTSTIISREVSYREGITFEEAHSMRHERRMEWRSLGDEMRQHDNAALAREVLKNSNLLVGVRARIELEQVKTEGLCDLILWIDRDVPPDPTMEFGSEMCDIVIQNHWGLVEYYGRLERLAKALNIYKGGA